MAQHGDSKDDRTPESTIDVVLVYVPIMALVCLILMLFFYRLWSDLLNRQRLHLALHYPCQSPLSQPSYIGAKINRHLIYAPLFEKRHCREFRICKGRIHMGTIPTRLETSFILGYVALNAVFCVSTVKWPQGLAVSLPGLVKTTGTLAVVNLIPLVVTAGRNNPLISLLRIQFDTFNLAHRWLGRIVVTEAVIHSLAVVARVALRRGWQGVPHRLLHVPLFIFGSMASVAFVLIFLHSLSPLRHAFYEFFLHSHIVLVIVSFVGLWYHLQNFVHKWIFLAALVAWGIDRMFRLVRVIQNNCGSRLTKASIQLLPGDVARVDVSIVRLGKLKAGQYMFLYIPALGLWTSHPFSAAWKSVNRPGGYYSEKNSSSLIKSSSIKSDGVTVSFLIRKRNGFTKKIMRSIANGRQLDVMALAEGPYGGLHSYDSYGTTLMIAGGIGITNPMSYLSQLVDGFLNRSVATRRITLLWVVRSIDHLQWIQSWMDHILNHPALQGAVTFSSKDATNPRTLLHVDDNTSFQQTLSLSIHVHLTSYYSDNETNSTMTEPSTPLRSTSFSRPSDCSSLLGGEEENVTEFDPIDASTYAENASLPSHHTMSSLSSSFQCSYPSSPEDEMPKHPSSPFRSYNYSNPASTKNQVYNYRHTNNKNNQNNSNNNINSLKNYSQYRYYTPKKFIRNQNWTQLCNTAAADITISLGKPLFRQLLEREMAQQVGAMAVSVCGPGGMNDEVRKAVRDVQGRKVVDFFEESFSW